MAYPVKSSSTSVLLCVVLFSALHICVPAPALASEAGDSQAIEVTDFRGKTITIPAPAKRIVCLIESGLSGIYMLGAEARVIAVSTSVYQESVFPYYAAMDPRIRDRKLPTPGNWDFVNIEMVVGLRPDLVIIWSHQEESIRAMEERGIRVYGVFIGSLDDIYGEIMDLGRLTGSGERARELVDYGRGKLAEIDRSLSQSQPETRPRVYYMWAQGALETAGKNSTVQELIDLAGGRNVAGHIRQEHLVVNMENILTWNPQVVVMWYNARQDPEDIMSKAMWRSVSAVRNRRVHEFPEPFSCDLWTLKYIYAVELLARWCYPELFKGLATSEHKWELLASLYAGKLDASAVDSLMSGK